MLRRLITSSSSTRKGNIGTIRIHGPDSYGIVGACSQLLGKYGYNIIKSEQWTDRKDKLFFQRIAFSHDHQQQLNVYTDEVYKEEQEKMVECEQELSRICSDFQLNFDLNWRLKRKKIGIMVSKYDHCLWELLLRHSAKELDMSIEVVISNHDLLRGVVEDTFDLPYYTIPVSHENKQQEELEQLKILQKYDVDVVVLARYMQVLSENFLSHYPSQIINIHHSFLPAFQGGRPYHNAWDRGVKLIGATAHYATLELDDGPIIEQDVIQVSHRDEVKDMMRKGRMLERNVLMKALEAHLDDRIIVYNNRCVVFND